MKETRAALLGAIRDLPRAALHQFSCAKNVCSKNGGLPTQDRQAFIGDAGFERPFCRAVDELFAMNRMRLKQS
jgi:hypothetical protein